MRGRHERGQCDCVGIAFVVLPLALVVGIGVSWAVLAWATNAWVAPTVTLGGSAAAGYVVAVYQDVVAGGDPAPPAMTAAAWGLCYGAVGIACLPRLSRTIRGLLVAGLLAPAVVYLLH